MKVVTFGLDTGPSNLLVRLTSISDGSEIHTRTFAGGSFGVGPVVPGEYILTVSDGEQIVTENVRARQTVSVGATNVALHEAVVLLVSDNFVSPCYLTPRRELCNYWCQFYLLIISFMKTLLLLFSYSSVFYPCSFSRGIKKIYSVVR